MASLRNTHGHAFFGLANILKPDKTKHDQIAQGGGFFQKIKLIAHGIGENRLKGEALLLPDKSASKDVRRLCGGIGIQIQLECQIVGSNIAESGGGDVGVIEGG